MIYRRRNPFVVGNSVGGTEAFVGREDIIAKVEATLLQPLEPGIVLFGQRRIGKTSILQELRARLARRGPWTPIFFDLQGRTQASVDDIIQDLAQAIARARKLPEPKFRHVTGEFSSEWLPQTLETLKERDRIVLLFDEFDVVADPKAQLSNRRLFEFLRSLFDGEFRQHIAAVFAMGRTMEDLDISAGPLFRGIRTEHVSTLKRQDFDKLLLQGEQSGAIEWAATARDKIWELTAGHPMLTQLLASSIWQAASNSECTIIDQKQVSNAVGGVLMESRNILGWLWDGLTPACRVVASSLAEHGASPVSMDELEQILRQSGVRIMMGQLTEAPARLRDWDLLEAEAEDPRRFRFKVELLRQWITQHRPFASVREYLDRLNPEADDYYNRALDRWNSNKDPEDITATIRLLELVLNDPKGNPNHVGATELLAEVYLAQNRLADAIQIVARLLPSQTAALRPRYVYLLLLQVESLTGEDTEEQRLQILDRILEVAPGTAEATTALHSIWRDRGRRALQAGRLVEARDCFRRCDNEALLAEVEDRVQAEDLVARIEHLDATEQWQEALELIEAKRNVLQRAVDIDALQSRLRQSQQKDRLYRSGCEATDHGNNVEAIDYFKQIVFIDPRFRDAITRLAVLLNPTPPNVTVPELSPAHVPPSPLPVPGTVSSRHAPWRALSGWLAAALVALFSFTPAFTSSPRESAQTDALSAHIAAPVAMRPSEPVAPPQTTLASTGEENTAPLFIDSTPPTPSTTRNEPTPKAPPSGTASNKPTQTKTTLKKAAAALSRLIKSHCKLGIEESSGRMVIAFEVDRDTGLVAAISVKEVVGRLEDPECLKPHEAALIKRLQASATPQKQPLTHTYQLEI